MPHADAIEPILIGLVVMLVVGKLLGALADRFKQPAVLGELAAGVLLGNLGLAGLHGLDFLRGNEGIAILSELGVILLLFEVGLDSRLGDLLKVGGSSLLVATVGVIVPMALGLLAGEWLLPQHSFYSHLFLGATLCATSVGITARVLKDTGKTQTAEGQIILGAAVIDDVLGLIVLAVVAGLIAAASGGEALGAGRVAWIVLKAALFLGGALGVGLYFAPRIFALAARLKTTGVLLVFSLAFCFLLSWLATLMGLAGIVGAFAAGLVLATVPFERYFPETAEAGIEDLLNPVSAFLVPLFFVLMGVRVQIGAFASWDVIGIALALTVAAIAGKQVCGLGVLNRGVDRLTVGLGMIPRGEVGLIFANVGLQLQLRGERIVDDTLFAAIIFMVMATTFVTPPALKWSLGRLKPQPAPPAAPA